jgi:hypothetical protein
VAFDVALKSLAIETIMTIITWSGLLICRITTKDGMYSGRGRHFQMIALLSIVRMYITRSSPTTTDTVTHSLDDGAQQSARVVTNQEMYSKTLKFFVVNV